MYLCDQCGKTITRQRNLRIHKLTACRGRGIIDASIPSAAGPSSSKKVSTSAMKRPASGAPSVQIPTKRKHNHPFFDFSSDDDDFIESTRPSPVKKVDNLNHLNDSTPDIIESSQPPVQEIESRPACNIDDISSNDSDNEFFSVPAKSLDENAYRFGPRKTTENQPGPSRETTYNCPQCNEVFTNFFNMQRHVKKSCRITKNALGPVEREDDGTYSGNVPHHGGFPCPECGKLFRYKKNIKGHLERACKKVHREVTVEQVHLRRGQINPLIQGDVFRTGSAYQNNLTNYQIMNRDGAVHVNEFLEGKRETVKKILTNELSVKGCIKFNLTLETVLQAPDGDVSDWGVNTENHALYVESDIDEVIDEMYSILLVKLEDEMLKGSGWSVVSLENLILKSSKYEPLAGSSYVRLPTKFENKKAVVNPKNLNDNQCFKWSVLSAVHLTNRGKHPERIENLRQYEHQFNFENMVFPVSIQDIKIFERDNPECSVCVYALDDKCIIYPVRYSEPKERHFDLLVLEKDEKLHYTYINDFSRLFSNQMSLHHGKVYVCRRCLTNHVTED
jgi:uncharacterized C2H2 Zn-finger protein